MSDLSERLQALPADRRALLERALLERRRSRSSAITPRETTGPGRLSAAQHRLWFLDQLAPGEPTYNAVVAMVVNGALDVELLQDAVRASIARHEVIRTVFVESDGEPRQVVLEDWKFEIHRADAEGTDSAQRLASARAIAAAFAREPYDLTRDLMLRCIVVEIEPECHVVAFGEHHIAFDGWSDEVFFGEVGEYYNRVRAGQPLPELTPLPIQFADYAQWQQTRLESGVLNSSVDYWATTLAGAPSVLELPLDQPRPERQSFRGKHLPIQFDRAEALQAFRQRVGATDFMVLVAAWAATLYRWSGQSDIVLGTPMANRNRVELEGLVGFFSNTVPLRLQIDGSQSFADLVRTTSATVLGAFEHQDLPFDRIVEAAAVARDPRVSPLCQVNVRVQSGPLPRLHLDGLAIELDQLDIGFARFDLAVEFQVGDNEIGGYLEYDEALFSDATAQAIRDRIDLVLGAALVDPDLPVWDLPQPGGIRRRRGGS
jgi:hypothetical protein